MRRIFVIGGCGFIGVHLVERLLATPGVEAITVYDNQTSGNSARLPQDTRVDFIHGHAQDLSALRGCIGRAMPDTVFHLAANPDIARAVREPTIDFEQGTILTQNVLEAMRVNGVKNLIYFSGSGVYGANPDVAFREDYGPMMPISTYGASKLASEALICAYCHMFGMTARAFRFANIVGPRQTHGVGYDFLRKLKADPTKLVVLGDGTQSKCYIAVDDALAAVFRAMDAMTPGSYDVFNVATDDTVTVAQIVEMACLAAGLDPSKVVREFTGGDRGWKGDVPKVRFNCEKIHSLGWRPKYTSKDASFLSLLAMAEEIK